MRCTTARPPAVFLVCGLAFALLFNLAAAAHLVADVLAGPSPPSRQALAGNNRAATNSINSLSISRRRVPIAAAVSSSAAPGVFVSRRVDEVKPDSVPAPWLDRNNFCRPSRATSGADPTAAVCDPSSLLSEHEIEQLSAPLAQIFSGRDPYSLVRCPDDGKSVGDPLSPNARGFRLAILVIRRMPYDSRTLSARAEAYAHTIFTRWGLSSSNCGASVLLFISIDDRRMYLQTGRLATKYLNTHQTGEIFEKMTPYMRKERLFPALKTAIDEIGHYLSYYHGHHHTAQDTMGTHHNDPLFLPNGPAWWDLEMSIVVIVLAAFLVCACCNGFGGPRAVQRKRDLRELIEKLEHLRDDFVRSNRAGAETAPLSLTDTGRMQELDFRLQELQRQYPTILTQPVMTKLVAITPDMWPVPLTEKFLTPERFSSSTSSRGYDGQGYGTYEEERERSQGNGGGGFLGNIGGLLAAGGAGALIASAMSGWGNNNNNNNNNNDNNNQTNSGYTDINSGGLPSWYVGSGTDNSGGGNAGRGASWLPDNDGNGNGNGAGWGSNGGNGQGAGWGIDGEGGSGASWNNDSGGGGDSGGDGDGAGF